MHTTAWIKSDHFVTMIQLTRRLMIDFCRKYVALTNVDVRQQYKADFNAEYDEYRQVHANVENVTRRFKQLDKQLKEAQENSEQYEVRL